MKIRSSNLPRCHKCPHYCAVCKSGEIAEGENAYDSISDVSQIGSAVHKCLELYAKGEQYNLTNIGAEFGVPVKQFAYLVNIGISRIHEYLEAGYEVLHSERQLENENSSGKCDLTMIHWAAMNLLVLDWKTGVTADCFPQLLGYTCLAVDAEPEQSFNKIYVVAEYLREGETITYETSAREAKETVNDIIARAEEGSYCTGAHCQYCQIKVHCPAYSEYISSSGNELVKINGGELTVPLQDLYEQSKILASALRKYDEALKAELESVGELILSDGRIMTFKKTEKQVISYTSKVKEIIDTYIPCAAEELQSRFTVSKSMLNDLHPEFFIKGQKGKTIAALLKELEASGETDHSTINRITITQGA